jgi:hypothetical protein
MALPRRDLKNLPVLLAFHPFGIQCPSQAMRRGALIPVILIVRVQIPRFLHGSPEQNFLLFRKHSETLTLLGASPPPLGIPIMGY